MAQGTESSSNAPAAGAQSSDAGAVAQAGPEQADQAAPPTAQELRQPTGMESFMAVTKSLIIRALVIYFITSFFRRPQAPVATTDPQTGVQTKANLPAFNLFENGTALDLYVFISESKTFTDFDKHEALIWRKNNLIYGDWYGGPNGDGTYVLKSQIETSEAVQNNGSIFLHVYVTKHGKSPQNSEFSTYNVRQLNKFKRRRYTKTKNLLTGETSATPEEVLKAETTKVEVVSHWHPNLTISLVTDQTNWVQGTVPPPLNEFIEFLPGGAHYKPAVYFNDFWNMLRDYQPINSTVKTLDIELTFQPLSLFKWQMYTAQSMRNKWTSSVFGDNFVEEEDEDQDSLKEALLETPTYLLILTAAVSILHSVFELLAFKNDIQFWNNRKSLEGLSVRSVFFNVFQSLVVLLYVLDNDTNTVVRISVGIGLLIEIWKIHKVVDIKINREQKLLGIIPRISFADKGSYTESSTKQYDMLAFRYLSWALYPLLAAYAVYALLYNEHRGWYSFILNMLYGFLLTFGFIMMTPQLFINYKMKSVAHLPWRMLSYKFLNTFIDDIFAFVIKMPMMYRLGCFRDDIVFLIFLYQRYIYKTDPTRVNEFGFSAEMEAEAKASGGQKPAIDAAPAEITKPKSKSAKKNE